MVREDRQSMAASLNQRAIHHWSNGGIHQGSVPHTPTTKRAA